MNETIFMLLTDSYSKFDEPFARIYNESWGPDYNKLALPTLEKFLLSYIPQKANILDLCCGTGVPSQWLSNKGYQVTGIDSSQKMLQYARENAPNCQLILGDVRSFELPLSFHAAFSTGLAFTHILHLEELISIFQNVYKALETNGIFLFDLRLEDGYKSSSWNGLLTGDIQENYAWAKKRIYYPDINEFRVYITVFELMEKNLWNRMDAVWPIKGYSQNQIQTALEKVGFREVNIYDLKHDLSLAEETDVVCFVCRKPIFS